MADCFQTDAPWRTTDPLTSQEAARTAKTGHWENLVLNILLGHPNGLTISELQSISGIPMQTCSPRFAPLRRKGLIADSGMKRRNANGKMAIVWIAL